MMQINFSDIIILVVDILRMQSRTEYLDPYKRYILFQKLDHCMINELQKSCSSLLEMASIEIELLCTEQSFLEDYPSLDEQNNANFISKLESSESILDDIVNITISSMKYVQRTRQVSSSSTSSNPTPDFSSKHRTFIIAVGIALFISISMIVGILTACCTASNGSSMYTFFTIFFVMRSMEMI
jgi:hypothetical protein